MSEQRFFTDEELLDRGAQAEQKFFTDDELIQRAAGPPSPDVAFFNRGVATSLGGLPDLAGAATSFVGGKMDELLGTQNIAKTHPNLAAALDKVSLPFKGPIGGRESIEFVMDKLGSSLPRPGEKTQTLTANIFKTAGETVGMALPFGAGAKAAEKVGSTFGRPLLEKIGEKITSTVATAPVTTAALEGVSAVGAGAGGFTAKTLFPDSLLAEVTGELLGGVGIITAPLVASKLPSVGKAGAKLTVRGVKAAAVPFMKAGALPRAEKRVQGLVSDPEAVARTLDEESIGRLSPATQTGDPRLMALEQAVIDTDIQLQGRVTKETQESVARLRSELEALRDGGNVQDTRSFIEGRREETIGRLGAQKEAVVEGVQAEAAGEIQSIEQRSARLINALDARIKQTNDIIKQRVSEIRPERQQAANSEIFREEVETLARLGRGQERKVWDDVPLENQTTVENSRERFAELWNGLSEAEKDLMPEIAKRFLRPRRVDAKGKVIDKGGKFEVEVDGAVPVKELQGLRSELLRLGREARADGNFGVSRLIDGNESQPGLTDALLDDMSLGTGPELEIARDFSRVFNEKFTKGAIGKVLRSDLSGSARVPATATLEALIRPGGKGVDAFRALTRAIEDSPAAALDGIQDFLKGRFVRAVVDENGRVNTSLAHKFANNVDGDYHEILKRFPELRRSFLDAREAQVLANSVQKTGGARIKRVKKIAQNESKLLADLASSAGKGVLGNLKARVKRLRSTKVSAAARFLDAPIDEEIAKIYSSRNPAKQARELVRQAAKDPTGDATAGLKAGVIDDLINQSRTGAFLPNGDNPLSGHAILGLLQKKNISSAVAEILTPTEIRRVRAIAADLLKLEIRAGKLPPVGGVTDDVPSTILSFVASTVGARAGAKLGAGTSGASLKTSSMAVRVVNKVLGKLTNDKAAELIKDVIFDKKVFQALLTPISPKTAATPKVKRALDVLGVWLAGPGSRLLGEDELIVEEDIPEVAAPDLTGDPLPPPQPTDEAVQIKFGEGEFQ